MGWMKNIFGKAVPTVAGEPVPEQAVSQQHAPDTAAALAGGEQWDAAPADEFSAQPGEPGPPPAR